MQVDEVVAVDDLRQVLGGREILRDISFQVHKGEVLGLLGPSGSGKTTLVKAIAGIGKVAGGKARVFGQTMPALDAIAKIGYMAQSDALYLDMSGMENLMFFGRLYGIPRNQRKSAAQAVIDLVQLGDAIGRPVHTYSGGMKRRLSLAIALQHDPDLLILDEPTVGLDPLLRRAFWQQFLTLKERGVGMIITTHVMDEASHCDRLALIRDGSLIALGRPDELMAQASANSIEEAFLFFGGEAK